MWVGVNSELWYICVSRGRENVLLTENERELCLSLIAITLISSFYFIHLFNEEITCQPQIFTWMCSDEQNRYSTYFYTVSLEAEEWDPGNDTGYTCTLGTELDTYHFIQYSPDKSSILER